MCIALRADTHEANDSARGQTRSARNDGSGNASFTAAASQNADATASLASASMAAPVREPSGERARAIAFLLDAYDGVPTRPGKGLPHAQAVADVLRDSGYDLQVEIAGLLHDVIEDTDRTVADVRKQFGDTVAETVAQLTEDDSIQPYAPRKHALREQLRAAGPPAMDIALADKIATLHHALLTDTPVRNRKRQHYRATLEIARDARADGTLCRQVEQLLDQVEAHAPAYA